MPWNEKLNARRYIQKRECRTRSRFFGDPDMATSSNFQVDELPQIVPVQSLEQRTDVSTTFFV
jgi:hypothetical protein